MGLFLNKKRKGFSLVELLLVLGVIATLLVAAFVVYPRVRDSNRANAEAMNLTVIKTAVMNMYASQGGTYTGLKNNIANQARVVPAMMNGGDYSSTASIKSTWGEDVTIGAVSTQITIPSTVNANRSFRIIYTKVPKNICLNLVSAVSENFFKITVNGTDVITAENNSHQFNIPLASEACGADTNQQIAFYAK